MQDFRILIREIVLPLLGDKIFVSALKKIIEASQQMLEGKKETY